MKVNFWLIALIILVLWLSGYALEGLFDWRDSVKEQPAPIIKQQSTPAIKDYTPPAPKPIYQPLPREKTGAQSNIQLLPQEEPKEPQANIQALPQERSKKPKSNYQPLSEVKK